MSDGPRPEPQSLQLSEVTSNIRRALFVMYTFHDRGRAADSVKLVGGAEYMVEGARLMRSAGKVPPATCKPENVKYLLSPSLRPLLRVLLR